jgi:hypothetical protein
MLLRVIRCCFELSEDQLWRSGGGAAEHRECRAQKRSNERCSRDVKSRQLDGIEKRRAFERQSGCWGERL